MSHLLQGISNGTRHLRLSNWTEPLVLAHLPGPLWPYWMTIVDYDQSTDSHFTCSHLHARCQCLPNCHVKIYPVFTHILQHSSTTAKCFLACESTTYSLFSQEGHRASANKPSITGHLSLVLQKRAQGQTLLSGLINVSSLIKQMRLSHWCNREQNRSPGGSISSRVSSKAWRVSWFLLWCHDRGTRTNCCKRSGSPPELLSLP